MREHLDPPRLAAALTGPGSPWHEVVVHPRLGSTNAEAMRDPRPGRVVIAEHQVSGRGRLARSWQTPDAAAVTMSVTVAVPQQGGPLGWLPLLTGLAVHDTLSRVYQLSTGVKWPNDVLAGDDGRKLCGILCELAPQAPVVVIGVGLNVDQSPEELPVAGATSLRALGVPDTASARCREELVVDLLGRLAELVDAWRDGTAEFERAVQRFRAHCTTVGSTVRVTRPGADDLVGVGAAVDDLGRLVVATAGGPVPVAAGDVHHVRDATTGPGTPLA